MSPICPISPIHDGRTRFFEKTGYEPSRSNARAATTSHAEGCLTLSIVVPAEIVSTVCIKFLATNEHK